MTPDEERDYHEALRRIKEAEANNSVELNLGGLSHLSRFRQSWLASIHSNPFTSSVARGSAT
jgi:hypothetical protein